MVRSNLPWSAMHLTVGICDPDVTEREPSDQTVQIAPPLGDRRSRPGTLVNDRPQYAEPITQLAEPRCEERLLQRHVYLTALRQHVVDPLGFCGRIERQIEIHAADLLKN